MKTRQIGNISFSEAAYQRFTKKSKEEQIEQVYNSLNPKDRTKAEKLLTYIPNGGNITGRNEQEATQDNGADATGGSGGDNTDTPKGSKAAKGSRITTR